MKCAECGRLVRVVHAPARESSHDHRAIVNDAAIERVRIRAGVAALVRWRFPPRGRDSSELISHAAVLAIIDEPQS